MHNMSSVGNGEIYSFGIVTASGTAVAILDGLTAVISDQSMKTTLCNSNHATALVRICTTSAVKAIPYIRFSGYAKEVLQLKAKEVA